MQTNHAYVICFNIKRRRIDILDSSSARGSNTLRYGNVPDTIANMMVTYLQAKGLTGKASRLQKVKPNRLVMKWRDSNNESDYGIFCMRHMETY
ncbi:unnamed protein product, partial [Cuscuta epithymum]